MDKTFGKQIPKLKLHALNAQKTFFFALNLGIVFLIVMVINIAVMVQMKSNVLNVKMPSGVLKMGSAFH